VRRVFISYSHDGPEHAARVVEFAQGLREAGFEAWIDSFEPGVEDWAQWILEQIERADVVLCVCTATYLERWKGEDAGSFGVTWEGRTLRRRLYFRGRPPIRAITFGEGREVIPEELQSGSWYELPKRYEALLHDLRGEPQVVPVPVQDVGAGEPQVVPAAQVYPTRQPDYPDRAAIRALEAANRRLWLLWLVSLPFSAAGLVGIAAAALVGLGWAGWMYDSAVPVTVPRVEASPVLLVRVEEARLSAVLAGLGAARAVYVHAPAGPWWEELQARLPARLAPEGGPGLRGEWAGEEEVVRIRAGWGWRVVPLASAWPCQIDGELWAGAWAGAMARGEAADPGWCERRLPRGRLAVVGEPVVADLRGGGEVVGDGKVVVVEVWRGGEVGALHPVVDLHSGERRELSGAELVAWSAVGWAGTF
jgi:hypothetical protein